MSDANAIIGIIAKEASLNPDDLSPNTELKGLSITSLDMLNVMFSIEDMTGVLIEPDDISELQTVGDLVELVLRKSVIATDRANA